MIALTTKVFLSNGRSGRKRLSPTKPAIEAVGHGRIPRISRLMALAIKFDSLIRAGKVTDQSELARLAHVTQPRMTQIMNLLHLAPEIQEELLFLPLVLKGRDPIHERMLRPVTAKTEWTTQRKAWLKMRSDALEAPGEAPEGACRDEWRRWC